VFSYFQAKYCRIQGDKLWKLQYAVLRLVCGCLYSLRVRHVINTWQDRLVITLLANGWRNLNIFSGFPPNKNYHALQFDSSQQQSDRSSWSLWIFGHKTCLTRGKHVTWLLGIDFVVPYRLNFFYKISENFAIDWKFSLYISEFPQKFPKLPWSDGKQMR
jgi:hypothetical protein